MNGSQNYDAIIWSSGLLVKHGAAPKKLYLEVTMSIPENDYLTREFMQKEGYAFAAKGTIRDKKTKSIISKPHTWTNDECQIDMAKSAINQINKKSLKEYPSKTVLIVSCRADGLILLDEWDKVVEIVAKQNLNTKFYEVFLIEERTASSITLRN